MTVYRFAGVEYLLGVNPAFAECADVKDEEIDSNKVDACWVDVQLVLYIDIMALSMHKANCVQGERWTCVSWGACHTAAEVGVCGLEVYVPAGN
jgi:hypothetical protein